MKFKVYISGPMTGLPNDGLDAMIAEEAVVRKYFEGHEVEIVNPARMQDIKYKCQCIGKNNPSAEPSDIECADCGQIISTLDYCATILRSMLACRACDVLWLMDGWQASLGCCMEVTAWRGCHVDYWPMTASESCPPDLKNRLLDGMLIVRSGECENLDAFNWCLNYLMDSLEANPCT